MMKPLTSTPLQIFAAGGKRLTEVGAFTAKMSVREHEAIQSIYVVRLLRHALLGRPAIEALQILRLYTRFAFANSSLRFSEDLEQC